MKGPKPQYAHTLLSKRNVSTTVVCVVLALFVSSLLTVEASSTQYMQLTGRGSSMYPTIKEGDRLTIQLCTDGSLINVGDIIAYSTIATGRSFDYTWIGHRVVDKYMKDGKWYFETKGDNNPEADPWEVPEYCLLGIVVNIEHTESSNELTDTTSQTDLSQTEYSKPSFLEGTRQLLITFGGVVLGAIIAVFRIRRERQKSILKKANVLSCYTCKHYQVQYTYRPELVDGRVGIRKVRDFSRGFCKHFNQVIEDVPRRNCEHYETKTYPSQ